MIWLYIGPQAAGKSTYTAKLKNLGYREVIMYTTRPRRSNETNDLEYHFIDRETFLSMLVKNKFVEHRVYNVIQDGVETQWLYGSPLVDPTQDYFAQPDIDGAYKYIKQYGKENINITFVYADEEIRHMRAKFRANLEESEWQRRALSDRKIFCAESLQKLADYLGKPITVLNNNNDKPLFSYIMNSEEGNTADVTHTNFK